MQERYQVDNFGLNVTTDEENKESKDSQSMTPETQKILKALNEVPLIKESDTLGYLQTYPFGRTGITQGYRINSEISLTPQTA